MRFNAGARGGRRAGRPVRGAASDGAAREPACLRASCVRPSVRQCAGGEGRLRRVCLSGPRETWRGDIPDRGGWGAESRTAAGQRSEADRQSLRTEWGGDGHPFPLQPKGKLRPRKEIGLICIPQYRNWTRTQRVLVRGLSPSLCRTNHPLPPGNFLLLS